jgi:hypothetical protein
MTARLEAYVECRPPRTFARLAEGGDFGVRPSVTGMMSKTYEDAIPDDDRAHHRVRLDEPPASGRLDERAIHPDPFVVRHRTTSRSGPFALAGGSAQKGLDAPVDFPPG